MNPRPIARITPARLARDERADDQHDEQDQPERDRLLRHRRDIEPAEHAGNRSRVRYRGDEADDPRGERDHLADDAADEREQRRQRDDGHKGDIESVHRRRLPCGTSYTSALATGRRHCAGAMIPL